MNIEEVREFALSLHPEITEVLFAEQWISWRIFGKWFLLMQLDAPEPRVAVKLPPDEGAELRVQYDGVQPAYHMNKTHWNDLYLNQLDGALVRKLITRSFQVVAGKRLKK
ncbi:MAG: MmcQ/YjbR family DNA-binding protein [Bacteroidales bacterium]|nr:MmcQ/YjbR family DNA-binding protein [Bacteroidales bacterium]